MKKSAKMGLNKQKADWLKKIVFPGSVCIINYGLLLLYFWHCFCKFSIRKLNKCENYEGIPEFFLLK